VLAEIPWLDHIDAEAVRRIGIQLPEEKTLLF
jgi:hypothetical protein